MTTTMHTEVSRPSAGHQPDLRPSPLFLLRYHWPEYCMEAAALGMFMISACVFAVLLEHPSSPLHQALQGADLFRRALMGLAMGLTAILIICSPWGQRSGAHMNPAVTLAYFTLGKIAPWDAFFYIAFQFLGGIIGMQAATLLIGLPVQHTAVNYVVTVPGPDGPVAAAVAEFVISALLMSVILLVSNSRRLSYYTPLFAGMMVAVFITLEAPFSGMSMNPARTFGSAFCAHQWTALWVYFTAPPAAMIIASFFYRARYGIHGVFCAKLHHCNSQRCIFRCRYGELHAQ